MGAFEMSHGIDTDTRLADLIQVFDDTLAGPVCDDIVRRFDKDPRRQRYRSRETAFEVLNIDCEMAWRDIEKELLALKDRYFELYRERCPGHFPAQPEYEAIRIKRYDAASGDQFDEQVDCYNPFTEQRFLVMFWYLNDVELGGETAFRELGVKVQPRRGRLVMFPPFWMYRHAGLRPESGPKYIVSTYMRFE